MSGKGRLERMTKMREMLTKSKDSRKPVNSREVRDEDFPELEFKYVSRRESSRRMDEKGNQIHRALHTIGFETSIMDLNLLTNKDPDN